MLNFKKVIQRFFIPAPIISLIYFLKYRCFISMRAEVELSKNLIIGPRTKISSFTKVKATDGTLRIGREVSIATSCYLGSGEKFLEIGDYTLISPNVSIIAGNYRYDRVDQTFLEQGGVYKGIRIGKNVWIGSGVSILDGSVIEDGVIVSANSVVSGKIPKNSIVQGNPAKVIFTRR